MATVRLTPNEVQVDQVIYVHESASKADAFEACVAALDVAHCVLEHPPQGTRDVVDGAD